MQENYKKLLVVEIPMELDEKMIHTSSRLMLTRPSLVRFAINKFCEESKDVK